MGYCSLKRLHGGGLGEGSFTGEPERWNGNGNGSIFPCGSSIVGLPSGDPEGHREEGSEDGYVRSPGNLRDS